MAEPTPLMRQYQTVKEQHGDAIVLFRLGDFYEMFGRDAEIASPILQIALTTRDKNKDNPLPMCGIPHFSAESYIGKLIRAGHKVAVCEQVEDPGQAKGIVKREVVRVITPGTHTPEHPKEQAYLLSLFPQGAMHGIAVADVSTGEFLTFESAQPLEDELSRFEPAEIVMPHRLSEDIHYSGLVSGYAVTTREDWTFDYPDAYRLLLRHFGVASLEGFGVDGMTAAICAAGALMAYLEETQRERLRFRRLSPLYHAGHMFLDAPTKRNLELVRNLGDGTTDNTLLSILDVTLTPMGGRLLRTSILRPLLDLNEIRHRQAAVKYLFDDYELIETLRGHLRRVQDLERLAQRIATGSGNARDLAAVRATVAELPALRKALTETLDGFLVRLGQGMADLSPLSELIGSAISEHPPQGLREGGIIRAGYHDEVDELRGISHNARDFIAKLEAKEKDKTGISSLKVGFNKIHGYYIEVTKPNLALVPDRYERKQTLVGGERFITPDLKEYESKVLGAEDRLKALEYDVFQQVLERAKGYVPALADTAASLAMADLLLSLAVVAKRHDYVMPHMNEGLAISIAGGRHPVIERLPLSERFIPNETLLDGETDRLLLITGPNMAGKSTYMRQVALIVLMGQMGSFVPAEEARIGIVDRIFTRIGAGDVLTKGQSTFMVEMIETANILNNATDRSLILLDEIGRGTSTFDGISIAWAAAEHIASRIRARTLFATHYNELTDLAHALEGVKNLNVAVKEWGDEIIFLRKIERGPADKSYGIQVARLAGLPADVLEKAKEVLGRLEQQHRDDPLRAARQMDLFAAASDPVLEALLSLDPDDLPPAELAGRLRAIRKRFAPRPRG